MAKKTANSGTPPAQKPRKPRTPVEKVFVVSLGDKTRLVAGVSKRRVEAAVWRRPVVRIATPTDLRKLTSAGVLIETSEPEGSGQTRMDTSAGDQGGGRAEIMTPWSSAAPTHEPPSALLPPEGASELWSG